MTSDEQASLLVWDETKGLGFFPVIENGVYGSNYWKQYVKYRESPIAEKLMLARCNLVDRHVGSDPAVDIGIGSGHFIEKRGKGLTFGYDVNPLAIRWLLDRDLWWDPFHRNPVNVSCWDSLEHMARPSRFIECVRSCLFLSVPIFDDRDHVLRSKHFKPQEHYWYWTRHGLEQWMLDLGFVMVEHNEMESELGREDIGTFVFRRRY